MAWSKYNLRGFSLVEVLVVASILLLVFGGLLYGYKFTLDLVLVSRSEMTAMSLMNSQMEYIQSLAYDAVGTQGGVPAGPILQNSTTTLNTISFNQRVLIEYVDDPADGTGSADSNGITTDYKRVKIEYTWTVAGNERSMFLVSNIVPRSIESDVGGGTLRVNVFNASVTALPGALVRLVNTTATPPIDVTRYTDSSGQALFGGTPAGSGYELFVTRTGYSADQTHQATTDNPNPTTLPVTVLEADVTTMNFFIDQVSSVQVRALSAKTEADQSMTFTDTSMLSTSTNTTVVDEELRLAESGAGYAASGVAYTVPIAPTTISQWSTIAVTGAQPADTTVRWSVYQATNPPTLVPDTALADNSTGFSVGVVDISNLSPTTYPSLQVGLTLQTASPASSPAVSAVNTSYITSLVPRSGLPVSLVSQKSIGTNESGQPVSKHQLEQVTNSSGEATFSAVEWGLYEVLADPYTIAEACPNVPHVATPGVDTQVDLTLVSASSDNLRVIVEAAGAPATNAAVTLSRPGFSATQSASSCGQVFFDGVTEADDYVLEITHPGYTPISISPFAVVGTTVEMIAF